jgi:uncharacterized membrane protein
MAIARSIIFMVIAFTATPALAAADMITLDKATLDEGFYLRIHSKILNDGSFSVVAESHDEESALVLQYNPSGEWQSIGRIPLGRNPDNGMPDVFVSAINPNGTVVAGMFRKRQELFIWTPSGGLKSIGSPNKKKKGTQISVPPSLISDDGSVIQGNASDRGPRGSFVWVASEGFRFMGRPRGYDYYSVKSLSADGTTVVGIGLNYGLSLKKASAVIWSQKSSYWSQKPPSYWTRNPTYKVIGDLPGGVHKNYAVGVSADGSRVVGIGDVKSTSQKSPRTKAGTPYIWTSETGFQVLPKGDYEIGSALMISGNGSVILGEIYNLNEKRIPVCWNEKGELFFLRDLLAEAGMRVERFDTITINSISENGFHLLGHAQTEAGTVKKSLLFRADLSRTSIAGTP